MSELSSYKIEDSELELYKRNLPIDLNLIDSALFIKNKQWCNSRSIKIKNQKIEIIGGRYVDSEGKTVDLSVPGEFDENVFYSIIYHLLKYKEKNHLEVIPQTIVCTYADLVDSLKLGRSRPDKVRESLRKLRYTLYQIHEYFLTRENGELLDEDEASSVNKTEKIKRISITDGINILESFTEIKVENLDVNELHLDTGLSKENINKFIDNTHKGTKYFLKIKLNDKFYRNLISKVYMLHSIEFLLELQGVERAIYTFSYLNIGREIYKGKNYPIDNKLIINVGITDIAERVPLSIDDKKISSTFSIIINALTFLMTNGYIKSFYPDKKKPIRDSKISIEFFEEQSRSNSKYSSYDVKIKKNSISKINNNKGNDLFNSDIVKDISTPLTTPLIVSPTEKEFNRLICDIQNKLGVINSGNMEIIIKLFKDNEDIEVKHNDNVIHKSKGLLIVESIGKWLKEYPNLKKLNGLLSKGLRNQPLPLYIDTYNEIINNLIKEHNIQINKQLLKLEKESKKQEEKNELRLAEEKFNSFLSIWETNFFKEKIEVRDKFINLARNKIESLAKKNITLKLTLENLSIVLYANNKFGKDEVSKVFMSGKRINEFLLIV